MSRPCRRGATGSPFVEPTGGGAVAGAPPPPVSAKRGADEVEFNFSANPGVPPGPLRDTASGGELSRTMLAIRIMVTLGDDVETLIFDEVDAGIGGVTAAAGDTETARRHALGLLERAQRAST